MKKIITLLIIIFFVIAALGFGFAKLLSANKFENKQATATAAATLPAQVTATSQMEILPTLAPAENTNLDYKNLSFQLEDMTINLVDGSAIVEAAPGSSEKISINIFGNEAFGDLNDDGQRDVVFLITQSGAGSGTFFYVVAALQTQNGYQGTNALFLGDRIAPQTTNIENGMVAVNFADRNPGEPFTTKPSLGVTKYYVVKGGLLVAENPPSG